MKGKDVSLCGLGWRFFSKRKLITLKKNSVGIKLLSVKVEKNLISIKIRN